MLPGSMQLKVGRHKFMLVYFCASVPMRRKQSKLRFALHYIWICTALKIYTNNSHLLLMEIISILLKTNEGLGSFTV